MITKSNSSPTGEMKESNYVVIPGNDCTYSIRLFNRNPTRCDASVTLDDDDHVGTFRIEAHGGVITIERPTYSDKKFTFYEGESRQAGHEKGKSSNGLVKVVFNPEKKKPAPVFFVRENEKPKIVTETTYNETIGFDNHKETIGFVDNNDNFGRREEFMQLKKCNAFNSTSSTTTNNVFREQSSPSTSASLRSYGLPKPVPTLPPPAC